MGLAFTLSDAIMYDAPQTVVYTDQATAATVTFPNAYGLDIGGSEQAGDGGFFHKDARTWWLQAATFGLLQPTEGGTITDASGVKWSVLDANLEDMGTFWIIQSRKER